MTRIQKTACLASFVLGVLIRGPHLDAQKVSDRVDFVRAVQPLLTKRCVRCHGPKRQKSGLRLDVKARALEGGDSGAAIKPGDSAGSLLVARVSSTNEDERMPPSGKPLTRAEIELLRRWIDQGAAWPESAAGEEAPRKQDHWAFRRPVRGALPTVKNGAWARNAIDVFVQARLEAETLTPSPEADRSTLVRRLSLDLTGLPPTPREVEDFVSDDHPAAYEKLVNRLLQSPAFGERWAQMWLDLARYADSKGYGSDPLRQIWRYRDWVIDAFNDDLPYDEFTLEQLAGDLLPDPRVDQILATAFHRNTMANDEGGTDDEEFRIAAVMDRVDTTLGVWMGLTAGCAKCHSHKYDPITQREYYSLFAFFNNTEDSDKNDERPRLLTPTPRQRARIGQLEERIREIERPPTAAEFERALAEWERSVALLDASWVRLPPEPQLERAPERAGERIAGSSAKDVPAPADGVEVTTGERLPAVTTTLVVDTDLRDITAFRLEVLPPGERLPGEGPRGDPRADRFVLRDLRVTAAAHRETPLKGRYVRIDLPGKKKMLSLAEVQVFGPTDATEGHRNLALEGRARQSSTAYGGPARLAIDGKTDGHYENARSTTHTRNEDDPWWEVDLGRDHTIENIVVWNRTDNNLQARLTGYRVSVLSADRNVVWESAGGELPHPSTSLRVSGPVTVALEDSSATAHEAGSPAEKAIDGDLDSGWLTPFKRVRQVAVFTTSGAIGFEGGTRLRFSFVSESGTRAVATRVRISATTRKGFVRAVPHAIRHILRTAAGSRTPEESRVLRTYFRPLLAEINDVEGRVSKLRDEIAAIEKSAPTTPILRELPAEKRRTTRILIKGNFLTQGDPVEPEVLATFHPRPKDAPANRLGLARWLVDERNPLTARVAVNRLWARLFARGLVETEGDFGTQGAPPSHPRLLDWLATELIERNWDIKALLRLIVTSATYRQSSVVSNTLLERDPANRWLARAPRFRLAAETVRDQALALSGLLSLKIGGPSVYPPQPPGLWRAAFNGDRTWPTSKGDDRYRRGLYTFWRRTVPYPSMVTFDAPSREICVARRARTNTPLQAFVTLNDPVYVEAAQALARRIAREGGPTPETCAHYGLRLCLARPPRRDQVEALLSLFESELEHYSSRPEAARRLATQPLGELPAGMKAKELAAWTVVANVLLNMDAVLTRS